MRMSHSQKEYICVHDTITYNVFYCSSHLLQDVPPFCQLSLLLEEVVGGLSGVRAILFASISDGSPFLFCRSTNGLWLEKLLLQSSLFSPEPGSLWPESEGTSPCPWVVAPPLPPRFSLQSPKSLLSEPVSHSSV